MSFNLNYPSQSKCQNNGISIWSVTISAVFTRQRKTFSIMGNNIESYLCQTKATLLKSQILYDIYLHFYIYKLYLQFWIFSKNVRDKPQLSIFGNLISFRENSAKESSYHKWGVTIEYPSIVVEPLYGEYTFYLVCRTNEEFVYMVPLPALL